MKMVADNRSLVLAFLAFIDPNNFGLVKVKELFEGQFFEIE